ncbi:hypothetical protein C0585_08440 [Candidatus Woesearchaeota archaeon]|nr:MAG: hypothetical protein C0585_08440 [Candidatus Woesearchaeota archaeon]
MSELERILYGMICENKKDFNEDSSMFIRETLDNKIKKENYGGLINSEIYKINDIINDKITSYENNNYFNNLGKITKEYNNNIIYENKNFNRSYNILSEKINEIYNEFNDTSFYIPNSKKLVKEIKEDIEEPFFENMYSKLFEKDKKIDRSVPDFALPPAAAIEAMHHLREEKPDIAFVEAEVYEGRSQHRVEVYTYSYTEGGEQKEMRVVAKDFDETEMLVQQFLREVGVRAPEVYGTNGMLSMGFVGSEDLKEVLKRASDSVIIRSCNDALYTLAQMQVLATAGLQVLKHDFGFDLPVANYEAMIRERFVQPISGSGLVSLAADRFMKAYKGFSNGFRTTHFVHGDNHTGNYRVGDDGTTIIDYEWAKKASPLDDISRFTNSVLRERPDIDSRDFSRFAYHRFQGQKVEVGAAQGITESYATFVDARINDNISKVGEAITYSEKHPHKAGQILEKGARTFTMTLGLIDEAMGLAMKAKDYKKYNGLMNLKDSFVDIVSDSPYQELSTAAREHQDYKLAA